MTHIERTITQEGMNAFADLPADRFPWLPRGVRNHHTNPEIARKMGLPGTVAQALHYCAFISQAMLDEFGQRWLEGGEMEMVFLQPVYAGDTLAIDLEPDEASVAQLSVNCRNQREQLVATGRAQVGKIA